MNFKLNLLFKSILIMILLSSISFCKKKDDNPSILSFTKTFVSEGENDGYIINTPTPTLHDYYNYGGDHCLLMGWDDNGYAIRSFLSFDISSIIPKDNKELIIEHAYLKTAQCGWTIGHPFNEDGIRNVNTYLVEYGELDTGDFDIEIIDDCGVLATKGASPISHYDLNVKNMLKNYIAGKPGVSSIQFRLQFNPGDNVPANSALSGSYWRILSGDPQGTVMDDYSAMLEITYHYK